MTRWWRRTLRLVGSLGILALLVALLPSGALKAAFAQASPKPIAVALAVFILCHLAAALKWRMLMGRNRDLSVVRAFRAHFTGLVGNLTPLGMIGGDIVRAGVAINGSSRPATIVVTSIVDRIIDTGALLVLTLIGFVWIGGHSAVGEAVLWGGLGLVALGSVGALAGFSILKRSRHPKLASVRDAAQMLVQQPGRIARALMLSISVQGGLILANAYIGRSVGVESSLAAWFLAWPAAKIAAYLPVGIAGIGVRESAMIALMKPLGGAAGPVLASGLLWDAVLIVGAVVGWFVLCVLPNLGIGSFRRLQTP
jgi:uncharacterized membrane protein YbhN (UPF0104 family)